MARARSTSTSKKKTSISVDFTGVETSGRVPEGSHIAEVQDVELRDSESSESQYLNFKLKVAGKGVIYHTCSLQPQALWNLRGTLEAMGMEVPDDAIDIDFSDLIGEKLGIEVENETYEGKKRPRVVATFSPDGEEEEEEEERPSKPARSSRSSKEEEEEEEEQPVRRGRGRPRKEEEEQPVKPTSRRRVSKEEEEEEEGGDDEIVKGSQVTFEDEGKEYSGKVSKIDTKSKTAIIVTKKGDEWEIPLDELTLAE